MHTNVRVLEYKSEERTREEEQALAGCADKAEEDDEKEEDLDDVVVVELYGNTFYALIPTNTFIL